MYSRWEEMIGPHFGYLDGTLPLILPEELVRPRLATAQRELSIIRVVWPRVYYYCTIATTTFSPTSHTSP